ncbi:phytanoyl-CoA dioxygenase family protein [Alteromonas gilva]|uniref:Phytanoyl-CoA dioxygenase family protein n=1 Tax=Alteromonas gilva TaxID=2987522 RepID=A0ABT5KYS3_9ALTE|nr:phytanoyl-CoA dioxygenase family protein [Alteromonas gilva]MDC8829356.1 phytanoyl-CoA dioxygenase family protein [Alteromonas gilva]
MNDSSLHTDPLITQGFSVLRQLFDRQEMAEVERDYAHLIDQTHDILKCIKQSRKSFADYYRSATSSLIVVPEEANPEQTCRFEYLCASSDFIRNKIVARLSNEIAARIGNNVVLFKDKCNIKAPGGGAFTAHQDIPAYIKFGPTMHITAAMFLDSATAQNGALEFATNYKQLKHPDIHNVDTMMGEQPLLPMYRGGANNGRIIPELEEQLDWQRYDAEPGDVILFNSYVPHRSAVNNSQTTRRAYFFTFTLTTVEDVYASYYHAKRMQFDDPRFHIATPTHYQRESE